MSEIDREAPDLGSLFQEVILSHYRHPHNRGELEEASADVHMRNPTCGDDVHLYLKVEDGRIEDVKFEGGGCSISQSSISMMTDLIKGHSPAEAREIARRFTEMMHGDVDAARDKALGQARALAGVARFPVRVKCALLGWNAMQEALKDLDEPPAPAGQ